MTDVDVSDLCRRGRPAACQHRADRNPGKEARRASAAPLGALP